MGARAIHHVTAVTAKIGDNLNFYTRTLGLRLVKKSVNQDDVGSYHLFYADAVGSPGTDMTFFDWPIAARNVPGAGAVCRTSFLIPGSSLDWWEYRLSSSGLAVERGNDEQGRERLLFEDPETQSLELVDSTGLPTEAKPWDREVPAEHAIRGIVGVDIESAHPPATRELLLQVLDFRPSTKDESVLEAWDDRAYCRIRLVEPNDLRRGRLGAGGVHHVAFRLEDEDDLHRMQERVEAVGIRTSGLVDRYYFKSLYFREPGGVLFELATDGPGFAADEDMERLGERLALPPFLEPHRERIEAGLKPLPEVAGSRG